MGETKFQFGDRVLLGNRIYIYLNHKNQNIAKVLPQNTMLATAARVDDLKRLKHNDVYLNEDTGLMEHWIDVNTIEAPKEQRQINGEVLTELAVARSTCVRLIDTIDRIFK